MIPRYYSIDIHKKDKIPWDDRVLEFYQKEGFTEKEIRNIAEKEILNCIWRFISEDDIKITIE